MKNNIKKIMDRELVDIFVLGTIYEEDDIKEFIPEFDNIYLQYDEYILCISKKVDFTLDISVLTPDKQIQEAKPDFDVRCSLKYLSGVFKGESAVIRQVDAFSAEINERMYVAALGLVFNDESYLFFDPLCFEGIAIGDETNKDCWIDEYPVTNGNCLVKIPKEKISFISWKNTV